MTLQEMYEQLVKPLSAGERLRLATLIPNDIPPQLVIDQSDAWTREDERDFSRALDADRAPHCVS